MWSGENGGKGWGEIPMYQADGKKNCFGILDRVFPVGEGGIREITSQCLPCEERKPCLKEALNTREGLEMRVEILERAEVRGIMNRLRRWSQKKTLSRLLES